MSVFVHAEGIKTVHAGAVSVAKKWQNSVNVVVTCPHVKYSFSTLCQFTNCISRKADYDENFNLSCCSYVTVDIFDFLPPLDIGIH